jgi:nucleoside-diphosphate-sugar epimerase
MGVDVTALGRNPARLAEFERQNIKTIRAELSDPQRIIRACQGQDIVFHCGALSAPWGRAGDFHNANVAGTENIIRGCEDHHVQRLVYVSTPSIYFNNEPRLNVREDADLPKTPPNEYARTKLIAEKRIDEAFRRGLPVISIRPRAIFGPGDGTLLPRLIDRLKKGGLRIIGDGKNIADFSFVENVVDSLLLCAEAPTSTLGKKYNITNGEQVALWEIVAKTAEALGYTSPRKHISYRTAMGLAQILEVAFALLPNRPEPPLTRYTVGILAISFTLDISAARQDLGYQPRVSIEEGLEKYIKWWKEKHS